MIADFIALMQYYPVSNRAPVISTHATYESFLPHHLFLNLRDIYTVFSDILFGMYKYC